MIEKIMNRYNLDEDTAESLLDWVDDKFLNKAPIEIRDVMDNKQKEKSCHCDILEMGDCDKKYGSKECNSCKFNY